MPDATRLVVVAIPEQEDPVWDVSSQKVPHMTLLYLGDVNWTSAQINEAASFVEHASSMIHRFGMSVDRRGTLGDSEADVLFFEKDFSFRMLDQFRSGLLSNDEINKAWLLAQQFPEWTPHLTLGYPDAPAKPNPRDYGINWVSFDKISLWTSDFDGPTFDLKRDNAMDLAMSDSLLEFLAHHGVKGMKWGVRKSRSRVSKARTTFKKSPNKLSDAELNRRIKRMETEKKYNSLNKKDISKGRQFAEGVLESSGRTIAKTVVTGAGIIAVKAALESNFGGEVGRAISKRL